MRRLKKTGIGCDLVVTGYAVSMAMGLIWVEVEGELLMLSPYKTARIGDEEFQISIHDAEKLDEAKAKLKSLTRTHAAAAGVAAREAFELSTGKPADSCSFRWGKPKKPRGNTAIEAAVSKCRSRAKSKKVA